MATEFSTRERYEVLEYQEERVESPKTEKIREELDGILKAITNPAGDSERERRDLRTTLEDHVGEIVHETDWSDPDHRAEVQAGFQKAKDMLLEKVNGPVAELHGEGSFPAFIAERISRENIEHKLDQVIREVETDLPEALKRADPESRYIRGMAYAQGDQLIEAINWANGPHPEIEEATQVDSLESLAEFMRERGENPRLIRYTTGEFLRYIGQDVEENIERLEQTGNEIAAAQFRDQMNRGVTLMGRTADGLPGYENLLTETKERVEEFTRDEGQEFNTEERPEKLREEIDELVGIISEPRERGRDDPRIRSERIEGPVERMSQKVDWTNPHDVAELEQGIREAGEILHGQARETAIERHGEFGLAAFLDEREAQRSLDKDLDSLTGWIDREYQIRRSDPNNKRESPEYHVSRRMSEIDGMTQHSTTIQPAYEIESPESLMDFAGEFQYNYEELTPNIVKDYMEFRTLDISEAMDLLTHHAPERMESLRDELEQVVAEQVQALWKVESDRWTQIMDLRHERGEDMKSDELPAIRQTAQNRAREALDQQMESFAQDANEIRERILEIVPAN